MGAYSYGLKLVTPASGEPVSREELKKQLEIAPTISVHDPHCDRLLRGARQLCESRTGRALLSSTWDLLLDRFPAGLAPIRFPRAPLISVTHLKYIDSAGTQQTWSAANYKVLTGREPGELHRAYNVQWPTARCEPDAVEVRFVAGYAAAADVPELVKQAILVTADAWFHQRSGEGTLPPAALDLLASAGYGDEFVCFPGD